LTQRIDIRLQTTDIEQKTRTVLNQNRIHNDACQRFGAESEER